MKYSVHRDVLPGTEQRGKLTSSEDNQQLASASRGRTDPPRKSSAAEVIVIPDDFPGYPINSLPIPVHYREDLERILLPHGLILNRVEQLAKEIAMQYGSEGFTGLCVLKDGHQFFVDFLYRVNHYNVQVGAPSVPFSIDFIRVKYDVDGHSNEAPQVLCFDSLDNIKGKNVLLVEGLIETGRSTVALLEFLKKYEPRNVKVVTLLLRRSPRSNGYKPDYVGFDAPDLCLVGYTIEFNDRFSDLCHVCVMNDVGRKKYESQK